MKIEFLMLSVRRKWQKAMKMWSVNSSVKDVVTTAAKGPVLVLTGCQACWVSSFSALVVAVSGDL